MRLVILRHGQDRNQCNASLLAILSSGSFIQGCKVGVHISGISTTSRYFLTCSGHFTECICVVGNVRHDYQYVHIFFECQILGCRQCHTRCGNTLDGRVICQVDEQYRSVDGSCLFKGFYEKVGLFECNTHSGKYYGEFLIASAYLCLLCDLRCQVGMWKSGCREDWKLLSTYQCVQSIDGRHTGLDELFRIASGCRVHRQTVDITSFIRQDLRSVVDRAAQSVEDTSKHIFRYAKFHASSEETYFTVT